MDRRSGYTGVDVSTYAADIIWLADGQAPRWLHVPFHGATQLERLRSISDALTGHTWGMWDLTLIVNVERPAGRAHTAAALLPFFGAVVSYLPEWVIVWEMRPAEWRVAVGLPGNAKKGDVRSWALEHGAEDWGPSSDPYDAYCLAHAARTLNEAAVAAAS